MKFLIFVKGTFADEEKAAADFALGNPEMKNRMAAMGAFNEELKKAGVVKDCEGLQPTRKARRVHYDGDDRSVTDGPFPSDDIVCGYWVWELASMDEAVAWAKRIPNPMSGPSDIDIRPIESVP